MAKDFIELREAIAAATPGPWHIGEGSHWSREVRRPDDASVAWCGHMAPQSLRDAAYIAAANPQTISDLLDDLDAARAELKRLTTLRPMSELTQDDGAVLLHDTAYKTQPPPFPEVADVAGLEYRSMLQDPEDRNWREWFGGWMPLPQPPEGER